MLLPAAVCVRSVPKGMVGFKILGYLPPLNSMFARTTDDDLLTAYSVNGPIRVS